LTYRQQALDEHIVAQSALAVMLIAPPTSISMPVNLLLVDSQVKQNTFVVRHG
jgi:hypothetical protein